MSAGSVIRQIREASEMSQRELSEKSGITQSMLSMIELDKIVPKLLTYEKVLNTLGYELVARQRKGSKDDAGTKDKSSSHTELLRFKIADD